MDFSQIVKKLNSNAKLLNIENKINFLSFLSIREVVNKVAEEVPFAKIAVFSTEKSYLEYNITLRAELKKANLTPISICLKNEKRLSVDCAKGLFNLAEDVRYLVVTDATLSEEALYFATVRNIPVLFILSGFNFKGITANSLFIDNGKISEKYIVSAKRVVAVDCNNFSDSDISDGIAMIGGKITALIDYRINSVLSGETQNAKLIELVEQAIDYLLNLSSMDKVSFIQNVLFSSVLVEFVRLADESFYDCSSAIVSSMLTENATKESAVGEFFSAKKIISRLVLACSIQMRGEKISDYNSIANLICSHSKLDFKSICHDILYKINLLNDYSGGVDRLRQLLINTVKRAQKEIGEIDKLYRKHGGKKSYCRAKLETSIDLSGYVGKTVNGLTLVKEAGF